MMRTLKMTSIVCGLLLGACENEAPKPKVESAPKVVDKAPVAPTPPPKPAKLTTAELVKRFEDCGTVATLKDPQKHAGCYTEGAIATMIDSGQTFKGAKAILEGLFGPFMAAFPDMNPQNVLILANGNKIAAVKLLQATQTGPLMGIPASNKKIGFNGLQILEMSDDGKITSDTHAADMGTLMGQIGVSPAPHRAVIAQPAAPTQTIIATDSKTESENIAGCRAANAAINKHDVAALLASTADDAVMHFMTMPADVTGKKAIEASLKDWFTAFPDSVQTISDVWGAGDYVVEVGEWTGTNTGDMKSAGLKKTGKPVKLHYAAVHRIEGGKLKEMWEFENGMAFAMQLGLMPPPGGAPAPAHQ